MKASSARPDSASRASPAPYSTEPAMTITVSTIHRRSPAIPLPLPKAITEPGPSARRPGLASCPHDHRGPVGVFGGDADPAGGDVR